MNKSREKLSTGQACAAALVEAAFPAAIESIPQVIGFVNHALAERGCPPKARTRFAVIVDEVVSNIAKYAYGSAAGAVTIRLSFEEDGKSVDVAFVDEGTPFNPLEAAQSDAKTAIDTNKVGGIGILIVRTFADEIEYKRIDDTNILRIHKSFER